MNITSVMIVFGVNNFYRKQIYPNTTKVHIPITKKPKYKIKSISNESQKNNSIKQVTDTNVSKKFPHFKKIAICVASSTLLLLMSPKSKKKEIQQNIKPQTITLNFDNICIENNNNSNKDLNKTNNNNSNKVLNKSPINNPETKSKYLESIMSDSKESIISDLEKSIISDSKESIVSDLEKSIMSTSEENKSNCLEELSYKNSIKKEESDMENSINSLTEEVILNNFEEKNFDKQNDIKKKVKKKIKNKKLKEKKINNQLGLTQIEIKFNKLAKKNKKNNKKLKNNLKKENKKKGDNVRQEKRKNLKTIKKEFQKNNRINKIKKQITNLNAEPNPITNIFLDNIKNKLYGL